MTLLARVAPLPQAAPITTSFLDSFVKAFDLSIEVTTEPPAAASSAEQPAASGSQLVGTAQRYTGVRYRWAGMSSRGMDCSGLIARVLRAHGIRAPHSAAQLFQLGRPVRFAELEPGDLLFFKTSRRGISHVGMYIGNDEFIHASSGAGRVITTSVYDPYYAKRLKGARRLGTASESEDPQSWSDAE